MLILTKKRRKRIHDLLEIAFNIPPGDVDMEKDGFAVDAVFAREFCRWQMVEATSRPRWNWRFWRRNKKCRPIPCPPFEEVRLEVE